MRLADLLDLSVLQTLTEANFRASGMPIGIVDALDGSVLVGCGWQDLCVQFHRASVQVAFTRCREAADYMKGELSQAMPCEYRCKNGLRDIGVPITVAGEHLATLLLGQFFYDDELPKRHSFARQARQLGLDEAAYLAALDLVPVFSRRAVEDAFAYNRALARFVSDLAEGSLRRKEAEAHAESLARFPQENPDPVLRLDRDLTVLFANEAARSGLRDLGVEPGRPAPAQVAELARRALDEGRRIVGEISCADRFFSMSFVLVRDDVNVYAHDITARVRAEAALREGDERLRGAMQRLESLLESSPLGVIEWSSRDFRIERWSDSAARIFGWSAAETLEKRIDELDWILPADRPLIGQVMADMASGKRPRNVSRNRNVRKDGAVIHCEWYNSTVTDSTGRLVAVLSLVLDVTERKRVEEELRTANRRKDEFLGMLSHELRNPLAPIRNALYILDRVDPVGERALRAREVANRQLTHLTRLVDDLLDVTRIARGKVELRRAAVDLADLTRRTGEDYCAVLQARRLDFVVEAPPEPVWVDGDETRLAQAIGNLLQNAAKFTPAGGAVTLSVARAGDAAEVSVRDTGHGLDPDLLEDVFEPFVQAKQSLARTEGGLGLGLALVKGLVELHGGTVTVASEGHGRGARFTICLPVAGVRPDYR